MLPPSLVTEVMRDLGETDEPDVPDEEDEDEEGRRESVGIGGRLTRDSPPPDDVELPPDEPEPPEELPDDPDPEEDPPLVLGIAVCAARLAGTARAAATDNATSERE